MRVSQLLPSRISPDVCGRPFESNPMFPGRGIPGIEIITTRGRWPTFQWVRSHRLPGSLIDEASRLHEIILGVLMLEIGILHTFRNSCDASLRVSGNGCKRRTGIRTWTATWKPDSEATRRDEFVL